MNRFCSIIPILLALSATHAQDVSPLRPLPFKSKERAIAGVFSLSPENITTEITGAYRYRDRIVVFGWSGHSNGIVTVINTATGKEILELLVNERFRFITPAGALIYAHWFVVGAYERDDSVWLLDLNHPVQRPKSNLGANVTDQAGFQIYPSAAVPHLRHGLTEMLPADDGQTLYLVDRPFQALGAQKVCFVAINVVNLNRVTDNHNCVDEKKLTGYSPGEIVATSLTFTPPGALRYSVTPAGETGKTETFTVNPITLTPSRAIPKSIGDERSETSPPPLRVPWQTEKQNLNAGDPINPAEPVFAGHEKDRIGVNLLIGESGKVTNASVSGSSAEVRERLEAVLRGWSFKPTILNGHPTKVRVEFETQLQDLSKNP